MCWPAGTAERRYAGVSHIDVAAVAGGDVSELNDLVDEFQVQVSALGYYPNPLMADRVQGEAAIEHLTLVIEAAAQCGVHRVTSFRWSHLFLMLPENQHAKLLSGIAEADETFFLNSKKGSRDLDRKPRKRGGKAQKRGLSKEQVCVLVARDRNGATIDAIMPQFTSETLKQTLSSVLDKDIMLCSDGSAVYSTFAKETDIAHKALNMSAGIRVIDKVFHN